jgi:carbamate kinase
VAAALRARLARPPSQAVFALTVEVYPREVRIVVALGGNALIGPDGNATPEAQTEAVRAATPALAALAVEHELVITHGNGPQVGNLLVKNEIAAAVVPPVPLDWCGAQTQATIGTLLLDALDDEFERTGARKRLATVVTRTLVDLDDPGFQHPTKPIGRYLPFAEAKPLLDHGQTWLDHGAKGWRRVVASPEPLEVLDAPAVSALLAAGFAVVAAGGGGVPTIRTTDEHGHRRLTGVQAVIDKDLTATVLAQALDADLLVVATDVDHAMIGYGTPGQRPLEEVTVAELRRHAADGEFGAGGMGPKVEAVCRFTGRTGHRSAITSLRRIGEAAAGTAGTRVRP